MRWVRPALTMSWNSTAFALNASSSRSSAGSRSCDASASAARCTADGKTSLELCPRLTWSLGCTPSPARFAITSFAFMFVEVPDPVWNTSIGNWSSNSPEATRSAAAAIRPASSPSSSPRSALTRAAAPLIAPSHRITGTGNRLAGDREVRDRLCRLATPQLVLLINAHAVPFACSLSRRCQSNASAHPQKAISSRASPTGSS